MPKVKVKAEEQRLQFKVKVKGSGYRNESAKERARCQSKAHGASRTDHGDVGQQQCTCILKSRGSDKICKIPLILLLLSPQVCTCTHGKYNALDEVEAGKVVEEADEADEAASCNK